MTSHNPTPPSHDEMIAAVKADLRDWENTGDGLPDLYAERHVAALRATIAQLEASRWRPISEYPREHEPGADTYWGPNVLLFVPTGVVAPASDYRIVTGRLEADMWLGWGDDGSMYDIDGVPSHFCLLPAPPAIDSED